MNHKTHTRRWTRARAVMALGMALGLGVAVTLAVFTDEAKFTTSFGTGTLDIQIEEQTTGEYTFEDWKLVNATPGAFAVHALQVHNKGSIDFTYSMAAPVLDPEDSALAAKINVSIVQVANESACTEGAFTGDPLPETGPLTDITLKSRTLTAGGSEFLCFKAEVDKDADTTVMGQTVSPVFTLVANPTP